MYEKADYELLRRELDINWLEYLSDKVDMESMWAEFKQELQLAIDISVPKRMVGVPGRRRKRANEKLPMNRKLWSKIKRKQRLLENMKIEKFQHRCIQQRNLPGD